MVDWMKMYKLSDKITKLITEIMRNWKAELAAGGKTLAEVKIQRGIFQEDELSQQLFVIAMMPLNYILNKYTGGNKFTNHKKRLFTFFEWMTSIFLQK